MKYSNKFSKVIVGLWLGAVVALVGCTGINSGCGVVDNGSGYLDYPTLQQISTRPVSIDMTGVKGFAVLNNHPGTRADGATDDGATDDSIQDPTMGIPAPYSLYSINEDGEINLSVFYFELISPNEGVQAIVENELKNAIQVVPSLLTDLGKYILFSGCQYAICKAGLSEQMQQICDAIIENQRLKYNGNNQEYLLRKSDGALFDITEQELFKFYSNTAYGGVSFEVTSSKWSSSLEAIVPNSYFIHKDNIYVITPLGALQKLEDNGDAIDVSRVTQGGLCRTALLDKDDNIFALMEDGFHIYRAESGFNILYFGNGEEMVDLGKDDQGNAYLFTKEYNKGFMVTSLANGNPQKIFTSGKEFWDQYHPQYGHLELCHQYLTYGPKESAFGDSGFSYSLGYNNGAFRWFFGFEDFLTSDHSVYVPYIVQYVPAKNEVEFVEIPANVKAALEGQYDYMALGAICYGIKVDGINIEVTKIDISNETVTTNSFVAEPISSIVGRKYLIAQFASPTLYVSGRNNINGAPAMVSINLLTGDNNASFAGDSRDVVTLLRIN